MTRINSPKCDENEIKKLSRQKEAIERLFKTEDGKALLEYLSETILFDMGDYVSDSSVVLFKEGRRSVLANLLQISKLSMLAYVENIKESQARRYDMAAIEKKQIEESIIRKGEENYEW